MKKKSIYDLDQVKNYIKIIAMIVKIAELYK